MLKVAGVSQNRLRHQANSVLPSFFVRHNPRIRISSPTLWLEIELQHTTRRSGARTRAAAAVAAQVAMSGPRVGTDLSLPSGTREPTQLSWASYDPGNTGHGQQTAGSSAADGIRVVVRVRPPSANQKQPLAVTCLNDTRSLEIDTGGELQIDCR
jgi:hypothetical protein